MVILVRVSVKLALVNFRKFALVSVKVIVLVPPDAIEVGLKPLPIVEAANGTSSAPIVQFCGLGRNCTIGNFADSGV